jgi:DNA-binding protein HU-beta
MNKADLISAVASKAGFSQKDTGTILAAIIDEIRESLQKGEKVQLVGFGTFEVKERAARKGRNPQTGEEIAIAASKAPTFKAGKEFKDAMK